MIDRASGDRPEPEVECLRCSKMTGLSSFPIRRDKRRTPPEYRSGVCRDCHAEMNRDGTAKWKAKNPGKTQAQRERASRIRSDRRRPARIARQAASRARAEDRSIRLAAEKEFRRWFNTLAPRWWVDAYRASRAREHYRNNPDMQVERVGSYKRANPERVRTWSRARRDRIQAQGNLSPIDLAGLRMAAKSCAYCGCDLHGVRREVDHMDALCLGGPNTIDNVVVACSDCNLRKGSLTFGEWVERVPVEHRARVQRAYTGRDAERVLLAPPARPVQQGAALL